MSINFLDYFLMSQLWVIALIFFRTGAAFMVLPGFGEVYVSPRLRLIFSLTFSVMLMPLLFKHMPAMPNNIMALGMVIVGEIMIGSFLGLMARVILSALHVAGSIIAVQSSLGVAVQFDPAGGQQSPVVSNLFSVAAIALFFTTDMHHLVIGALVQSYDVFQAGQFAPLQDINVLFVRMFADAFSLGVELAAPFIVMSLLFYLAGGLMARLMPNFQVFFVMAPPQMMLAFFLLLALTGTVLGLFINYMQAQFTNFVVPQ